MHLLWKNSELHLSMCDGFALSLSLLQAGSSSPVSSISGFSTNSHLEEAGEDGGMGGGGGGGGKEDRTPRNDPFAGSSGGSSTVSQANDPFAAFSVPGSDHFSSAGLVLPFCYILCNTKKVVYITIGSLRFIHSIIKMH